MSKYLYVWARDSDNLNINNMSCICGGTFLYYLEYIKFWSENGELN
jgi:hypothetical protein